MFLPLGAIQINQLSAKFFLGAGQRGEFCRIIRLSQDFLPFIILIHTKEYFFEALYNCFRFLRIDTRCRGSDPVWTSVERLALQVIHHNVSDGWPGDCSSANTLGLGSV